MNAWIRGKSQQQSELQLSARLVIHKKEGRPLWEQKFLQRSSTPAASEEPETTSLLTQWEQRGTPVCAVASAIYLAYNNNNAPSGKCCTQPRLTSAAARLFRRARHQSLLLISLPISKATNDKHKTGTLARRPEAMSANCLFCRHVRSEDRCAVTATQLNKCQKDFITSHETKDLQGFFMVIFLLFSTIRPCSVALLK